MNSVAAISVGVSAQGHSVVTELRGQAPQLLRLTDPGRTGGPARVHLLGGAAGPLGGDQWNLCVDVAARAHLGVASVAATLAQPGPSGARSHAVVRARVADEASLHWWPQPLIAVAGCDHHLDCRIEVATTARVVWVDEVVWGRTGEPGGRLVMRQRLVRDDTVLIDHELHVGPEVHGPGWHGPARVVITAWTTTAAARPTRPPVVRPSAWAAQLAPAEGIVMWAGVGRTRTDTVAALDDVGWGDAIAPLHPDDPR
jgi:urease accessory protein